MTEMHALLVRVIFWAMLMAICWATQGVIYGASEDLVLVEWSLR
jgi:hypothetical protein